jgi:diaminopimelate epimerase
MAHLIEIIPADPAGNKTIFVTTPVDRKHYQQVASFLLSLEEFEAEQVAFILPDGRMEMCGMEFCGNASRTYALIMAKNQGLTGKQEITVNVSGCEQPLQVRVNMEEKHTGIDMPIPREICAYGNDTLVDLGGIMHLVTTDKSADPNAFQRLKNRIMNEVRPPALGVMFYNSRTNEMTPVVYVADVDSTYFEGSCASGTVAAAAALTANESDGEYRFTITQPKGTLTAVIKKRQNTIESVSIEGPIIIGDPVTVQLPPELQI